MVSCRGHRQIYGANNICVNKVLRIEGVSAHCSMKKVLSHSRQGGREERHVKLRQSVEEGRCDSDISTDDEGEGRGGST